MMSIIKRRRRRRRIRTLIWISIAIIFLGMYLYPVFLIHNMFSHRVEIFETAPEQSGPENTLYRRRIVDFLSRNLKRDNPLVMSNSNEQS
jgi:hypothetical protein